MFTGLLLPPQLWLCMAIHILQFGRLSWQPSWLILLTVTTQECSCSGKATAKVSVTVGSNAKVAQNSKLAELQQLLQPLAKITLISGLVMPAMQQTSSVVSGLCSAPSTGSRQYGQAQKEGFGAVALGEHEDPDMFLDADPQAVESSAELMDDELINATEVGAQHVSNYIYDTNLMTVVVSPGIRISPHTATSDTVFVFLTRHLAHLICSHPMQHP
ncbi:hypothetical protein NDU88_002423 [Pleurodeles waltl]|uniref:Uncharacterized protein n=1 Tax=Pleurodeles waltl TaxID=8319 RepID=A0AAV7MMP9_PLEWA|nr:hypothetical protein NDU88_002423 [Pleurodeles waltl]